MWVQKSLDMKNLFLSPKNSSSDFTKIFIKLETVQKELRHQRVDLQQIIQSMALILDSINETPPQTDSETIPEQELI